MYPSYSVVKELGLQLLCVFLDQNCRSFFGSGSGYFKDKDKFLCCHVPRISFLWSISSPSVQSAFPPPSSSSLFVSSEKLFCDKKGALHVFRGDWEGRAKSYDTGTRFLQRARARSHTLSVCRCAARREISPDRSPTAGPKFMLRV